MLETVRQFAAEQIAVHEQEQRQVQMQHGRYYLRLLGGQEENLGGPQQHSGLSVIRADFANISAAWQWAIDHREPYQLQQAFRALFLFCEATGNYRTGVTLFGGAVAGFQAEMAGDVANRSTIQPLLGQALIRLGACEIRLFDMPDGEQHIQDGLSHNVTDQERVMALLHVSLAAIEQGKFARAHTYLRESLAISQQYGDLAGQADALHRFAMGSSDCVEACRQCSESLALWRAVGRPDRIASLLSDLAWNTWCVGDYAAASAQWRESLALCEQLDLPNEKAWVLDCLGYVAWCSGDATAAQGYTQQALAIYTALGRQSSIGMCKAELAWMLAGVGQATQAIALAQEAVAITRAVNSQMMLTVSLDFLGAALIAASDWAAARSALLEATQRAWEHGYPFTLMIAFYYVAELLTAQSRAADPPAGHERLALAVTVLSHVRMQKATWRYFKDQAARLQSEIEGTLSEEARADAVARGQKFTMQEAVNTLVHVLRQSDLPGASTSAGQGR